MKTKSKNNDLLLLGGVAALAALVLMNQGKSEDGGGSGGGFLDGGMFGGGSPTYGSDAPTVYQIPGDGGVVFPDNSGGDLGALLALLSGPTIPDGETKKEQILPDTYLDAGSVLPDGSVIKAPFISRVQAPAVAAAEQPTTKKEELAGNLDPNLKTAMASGAVAAASGLPVVGPAVLAGSMGLTLWDALSMRLGGFAAPAAEGNRFGGASSPWSGTGTAEILARAPAGTVAAKKEASVFGFSGQYVLDPITGLLAWNTRSDNTLAELGGFGLSKDPRSGKIVPYQRDVWLYGPSGNVYNPLAAFKGNPGTVVDSRFGTFSASRALDAGEVAKVTQQMAQNSPGAFSQVSKKEVVTNNGTGVSSLPASSPAASALMAPAPFISSNKKSGAGGGAGNVSASRGSSSSSSSSGSSSSSSSSGSRSGGGWGGFGGGGAGGRR